MLPDATTLYIHKEKLDDILAEDISGKEKRNKTIENQDTITPSTDDYDFHDFHMKKFDGDNYYKLDF